MKAQEPATSANFVVVQFPGVCWNVLAIVKNKFCALFHLQWRRTLSVWWLSLNFMCSAPAQLWVNPYASRFNWAQGKKEKKKRPLQLNQVAVKSGSTIWTLWGRSNGLRILSKLGFYIKSGFLSKPYSFQKIPVLSTYYWATWSKRKKIVPLKRVIWRPQIGFCKAFSSSQKDSL